MRRCSAFLFLLTFGLSAQSLAEQSRFEITGFGWSTRVEGTLQSGILPVDLQSDLALADRWTFLGEFVWHPAPHHKLLVEGAPLRFEGFNTLSRTIDYRGREFNVQEAVLSRARLDYVYAGYEFDILSRERGHLGINIGGGRVYRGGATARVDTGVFAHHS